MQKVIQNRPYIALCLITVLLSTLSILYSAHLVSVTQHQFCGVLAIRAIETVQKPADPKLDRAGELIYERHKAYIELAHTFGCIKQQGEKQNG